MATAEQLAALLHQIRHTRSPLQRFKLVTLAWRTLRGTTAAERRQLIREIGADGAERLVEGLARRGGLAPADLLTAIHQAETSGTAEPLARVLGGDEPDAETEGDDEPFGADPATAEPSSAEAEEPFPEVLPAAPAAPPPPAPEPTAPAATEEQPQTDIAAPGQARPAAPPQPPTQQRRHQRPAAAAPERKPHPASRAPEPASRRSEPVSRPRAEPGARRAAAADLLGDVAEGSSLLRRIRRLRLPWNPATTLDQSTLNDVLQQFPPGWARRRAAEGMLSSGALDSVELLLGALPLFDSATDRLWLLTAAAHRLSLTEAECERLLDAADNPACRRRLALRLRAPE